MDLLPEVNIFGYINTARIDENTQQISGLIDIANDVQSALIAVSSPLVSVWSAWALVDLSQCLLSNLQSASGNSNTNCPTLKSIVIVYRSAITGNNPTESIVTPEPCNKGNIFSKCSDRREIRVYLCCGTSEIKSWLSANCSSHFYCEIFGVVSWAYRTRRLSTSLSKITAVSS